MDRFLVQFLPRLIMWTLISFGLVLMTQNGHSATLERQMQKQASQKAHRHMPKTLDDWFTVLAIAPDPESAKYAAEQIQAIWAQSKSFTVMLLMERAAFAATKANNTEATMKLLSSVIKIAPDYFEARFRRSNLYYQKKEYMNAIADLIHVLQREPRHFEALMGLGMIIGELGDERRALTVFLYLQKIYPHMEKVADMVRAMERATGERNI